MLRWEFACAFGLIVAPLPGAAAGPPARPELPADLNVAWEDLASSDASKAYRAVWAFVQSPRPAVDFLQGRLKALQAVAPEAIAKLIEDLNGTAFAVRDKARRELERLAELAGPALRKAQGKKLTLEAKTRVEQLLARLRQPAGNQARELRALEALEQLGTDEARILLRQLAGGVAEARLSQEAAAALARLAKRPRPAVPVAPVPKGDCFGDSLPAGAAVRLGTVRFRDARCAALLPDGKTLAACQHGLLHLYDLSTGAERPGFPKQVAKGPWGCMAVSADGRFVAANWNSGKVVTVWQLPSGKQLHEFRVSGSYSIAGHGLAFSFDGKVLYGGNEATAHGWDLTTGAEILQLAHCQFPGAAARTVFSPGGKYLATIPLRTERAESVALWDVATAKRLHRLPAPAAAFAAFSSDGKTLATCGLKSTTICLWEAATGKLRRTLPGRAAGFVAVAFSPDGRQVAAAVRLLVSGGSEAGAVHLWEVEAKGDQPRILPMPGVDGVQFTPDGKTLACRCFGQAVSLLDLTSGKEIHPWGAHRDVVRSVAYSHDGTMLATTGADRTVRLWDAATGRPLRQLTGHTSWVGAAVFSPDGKLLAVGSGDKKIHVWEAATGAKKTVLEHASPLGRLAFSPDGRFLATNNNNDGMVRLWDIATGKVARAFESFGDIHWALAFSPDGKLLAEVRFRSLQLRDLATGQVVKTFRTEAGTSSVAFAPDGRTLAVAYVDRTVLWEVLTGEERVRFPESHYTAGGIAFSPDGRLLASGVDAHYTDTTIRVRDLATRRELGPFLGHRNYVTAVAFAPDGRRLATASADATVLIWDLGLRRRP